MEYERSGITHGLSRVGDMPTVDYVDTGVAGKNNEERKSHLVYEDVLAAVFRGDETPALRHVEPLTTPTTPPPRLFAMVLCFDTRAATHRTCTKKFHCKLFKNIINNYDHNSIYVNNSFGYSSYSREVLVFNHRIGV